MPAQLLPIEHYACSRSLCSAYRLLEDYGAVKPGDTIIQNCASLPTDFCKVFKKSVELYSRVHEPIEVGQPPKGPNLPKRIQRAY